jgi:hypothetical protein
MTALSFTALILLEDAQYSPPLPHLILIHTAVLCVVLALWVGATRVYDYWHTPADVVGGWLIGATVAYGVLYSGCVNVRLAFKRKHRNSFSIVPSAEDGEGGTEITPLARGQQRSGARLL